MAIYEMTNDGIDEIKVSTFSDLNITERGDIQRILRDNINTISNDLMVISEEFGQWDESSRRIDLLCLDKQANLVVVELKRTEDGGHMELQALRYAAMVSAMTFEQLVQAHTNYLQKRNIEGDAEKRIMDFLKITEPDIENFGREVKIILVSADFSKELTTAVLWLNQRDLDIRCIRIRPYKMDDKILVDIQQIVPLDEMSDYMIKVKHKQQEEQAARKHQWNEVSFMQALTENKGAEAACISKEILDWINPLVDDIWWGQGKQTGSFNPYIMHKNTCYQNFGFWTNGAVENQFRYYTNKPPFDDPKLQEELLNRINRIHGVDFTMDVIAKCPRFSFELLKDKATMELFKDTFQWIMDTIKAS